MQKNKCDPLFSEHDVYMSSLSLQFVILRMFVMCLARHGGISAGTYCQKPSNLQHFAFLDRTNSAFGFG